MMIRVASFNILAPAWAHPKWYRGYFLDQLSTEYRRPRVRAQIKTFADDGADLIFLQETQPAEVADLFTEGSGESLGNENGLNPADWLVYEVAHEPDYWQSWWITDPAELAIAPWTADHSDHGVALLVRKSSFTDVSFSRVVAPTGNAQILMTALYNGVKISAACIHYDSDSAKNRQIELESTLYVLPNDGSRAIIGGDFNFDTNSGNLQGRINNAGFVDVLYALSANGPTHPFSTNYYRSMNWASIDHFITRDLMATAPSYIVNNNLYTLYPSRPPDDLQQYGRISANFDLIGSDHFPLFATLTL